MNLRPLLTAAARSLTWARLPLREILGACLSWVAYVLMTILTQDSGFARALKPSETKLVDELAAALFVLLVVMTALSMTAASAKSALTALVAWTSVAPLYLLGHRHAAAIALAIAIVGTAVFIAGFAWRRGGTNVEGAWN